MLSARGGKGACLARGNGISVLDSFMVFGFWFLVSVLGSFSRIQGTGSREQDLGFGLLSVIPVLPLLSVCRLGRLGSSDSFRSELVPRGGAWRLAGKGSGEEGVKG